MKTINFFKKILPKSILLRLDTPIFHINRFIKFVSKEVKEGEILLDAGCGDSPYYEFLKHSKYIGTDFLKVNKKYDKSKLNFVSSLDELPLKDESVDTILCTQVLEHVENPFKVMNEFKRILKKEGKLFISVPQQQGVHEEPYNFFNYTYFGLENLFLDIPDRRSRLKFRLDFEAEGMGES